MAFWNRKKVEKKYRILSIDGGGMKGIFTAYAIYQLEEEYGIKIQDHFDMIVGTSTGALISAGLLCGKSGKEIYETYIDKDNPIFHEKKSFANQFKSTFFAGYEKESLEEQIREEFGERTLDDLYKESKKKDFAFFSSNFTQAKPVIYGSPSLRKSDMIHQDTTVFEALRTSTAAPFYFEPFVNDDNELILDGGIWANNPSLFAVALAASIYDFSVNQIEILSFGQTFTSEPNYKILKGKEVLKSPMKNQFVQLLMSVLTLSINSQTELVETLLGESVYRYAPEEDSEGVSVSEVSTKFINYSKVYWNKNKESLVEFIKTGKNNKV